MNEEQKSESPCVRPWLPGADVMATWRRYGYRPPTEYRTDYRFGLTREIQEESSDD
jgi:hypothetical protein